MAGKRNKKHQKKNSQQSEDEIEKQQTLTSKDQDENMTFDEAHKLNTITEPESDIEVQDKKDLTQEKEIETNQDEDIKKPEDEKEQEIEKIGEVKEQEETKQVTIEEEENVTPNDNEKQNILNDLKEESEEEEQNIEVKQKNIVSDNNGWEDDDLDIPTVKSNIKTKVKIQDDFDDFTDDNNSKVPVKKEKKTKIIKKIIRKPVVKSPKPTTPPPVQAEPVQTSGWGWFSSISSAVTTTINSITRLDEDDEDDFIEEEIEEEVTDDEDEQDIENNRSNQDGEDDETIMNAIDNGVFKTADYIADGLVFAGSFLTSGFKSVQENANIENVKGLAQGVANLSLETKKKATNSDMYEKGQKIASTMVDSSVDVLESVGQKAYSLFSNQIKYSKQNSTATDVPTTSGTNTQVSPKSTLNNSQEITSPSSITSTSPKDTRRMKSSTGSTSSMNSSTGISRKSIQPMDIHIFDDGAQFNSNTASEHFKIPEFIQEIEKLSVESTMKIHQLNRKLPQQIKLQVNQDLEEIKDKFENPQDDEVVGQKQQNNNNLFFNNDSFELQSDYNEYFDRLQEFLPTLKSKSSEATLCRGLENIYQLLALSLQLLSIISQSLLDKKGGNSSTEENDFNSTKESTIKRLNEIILLLSKYKQDIKSISLIITEILKSKPNPNSRKLINTLNIETNSAISHIDDSKGGLLPVLQISYLNEIKLPKKSTNTPTSTPTKSDK